MSNFTILFFLDETYGFFDKRLHNKQHRRGCKPRLQTVALDQQNTQYSKPRLQTGALDQQNTQHSKPRLQTGALVLISVVLIFCSFAARAEEIPLSLGRHLVEEGNYDAAITEYKRFLFFHPDDPRIGEIYYDIGLAYRAEGLWTEAIAALRTATYYAIDSQSKSGYQLALAVTLIATKSYDLAELELIKVMLRNPPGQLHRRMLFLQAVVYIYQFRWEEARSVLRTYTTDERLEDLFDLAVNLPQKSARVAGCVIKDPAGCRTHLCRRLARRIKCPPAKRCAQFPCD